MGRHEGQNTRFRKIAQNQQQKFADVIVDSGELKKLIIQRAKDLKVRQYHLCDILNISWPSWRKYLENDKNLSTPTLRQEHIIEVAKALGINVRITLVVKDIDKVDVSNFKLPYNSESERRQYIKDKKIAGGPS